MARTRAVPAYKERGLELEARIIEAINVVGPRNVSEISRLTNAPVETIRYKIKKQFKNLGFRIHAEAGYERLGLILHWGTIKFAPAYLQHASKILDCLNQMGYLVYYGLVLPKGYYTVQFALPVGATNEYCEFLNHLKGQGIIREFTLTRSLHTRHNSMNPRFFNFQSGKWEIDWTKLNLTEEEAHEKKEKDVVKPVDKLDLLLINQLQLDSLQHVVAIARKLKIHPKTLEYHYRAHVEGKKLIPRYYVRWMNDIDRSLAHTLLVARLTAGPFDGQDLARMTQTVRKIPFLWSYDVLSDGTFVAWLMIPLEETAKTFDYMHARLPDLGDRMNVDFVKHWETGWYTVPYHLFGKGWEFNLEAAKANFKKVLKQKQQEKQTEAA